MLAKSLVAAAAAAAHAAAAMAAAASVTVTVGAGVSPALLDGGMRCLVCSLAAA